MENVGPIERMTCHLPRYAQYPVSPVFLLPEFKVATLDFWSLRTLLVIRGHM